MKKGVVPFLIFSLLDTVYILTASVSFSVFLYAVNNSGFRVYLLCGVIAGFIIYHYTAGQIVMLLSESIVRFIRKAVALVVVKPIRWFLTMTVRAAGWIWKNTAGRLIGKIRRQAAILYTNRVMRRIHSEIRFAASDRKGRAQSEKIK